MDTNLTSEEIGGRCSCEHCACQCGSPWQGGWAKESSVLVYSCNTLFSWTLPSFPALWFPSLPSPSHFCPSKMSPSSPADSQVLEQSSVVGGDDQVRRSLCSDICRLKANLSVPRLPGSHGDCPLPLLVHSPAYHPLLLLPFLLFLPVGSLTCTMA